jgi:hypothetical protein
VTSIFIIQLFKCSSRIARVGEGDEEVEHSSIIILGFASKAKLNYIRPNSSTGTSTLLMNINVFPSGASLSCWYRPWTAKDTCPKALLLSGDTTASELVN